MGLFSRTCAKTHLPVLCERAWSDVAPRLTRVVVLTSCGEVLRGEYDGYGMSLGAQFCEDSTKVVLEWAYQGERYADLPVSGYEPGQGFFHDQAFIRALALSTGLPSYQAYLDLLDDVQACSDQGWEQALKSRGVFAVGSNALYLQCALEYAAAGDADQFSHYCSKYPDIRALMPFDEQDFAQAREFAQLVVQEVAHSVAALVAARLAGDAAQA